MAVLDVGCGFKSGVQNPVKADVSLDLNMDKVDAEQKRRIRELGSNAVQGDATHLPIRNGSIERIYWNALLEHIPRDLTHATLLEGRRVLKPGGEAHVILPIITSHMHHYLIILFTQFPFSLYDIIVALWRAHLYWHIPGVPHLTDVKPRHLERYFSSVESKPHYYRHKWLHNPWGRLIRPLINNRWINDIQGQYHVRCLK